MSRPFFPPFGVRAAADGSVSLAFYFTIVFARLARAWPFSILTLIEMPPSSSSSYSVYSFSGCSCRSRALFSANNSCSFFDFSASFVSSLSCAFDLRAFAIYLRALKGCSCSRVPFFDNVRAYDSVRSLLLVDLCDSTSY